MLNTTDFVRVIKKISLETFINSKPADILYGSILSVKPLKIFIDQKMILTEGFITVPKHLTDYEVEISFNDPDIKQKYTTWDIGETIESSPSKISFKDKVKHKITVYNSLKVGEKVILLRQQGGQKYLVVDKVVM